MFRNRVYVCDSALSPAWSLKLGPPLLTATLSRPSYLPCLLTGVFSNCRKWCATWAGELLTFAAWMQIAVLCGYDKMVVHRATHSAVVRGLSTRIHDYHQTIRYLYTMGPHLPLPHCCIINYFGGTHPQHPWRWHRFVCVRDGGYPGLQAIILCPSQAIDARGALSRRRAPLWACEYCCILCVSTISPPHGQGVINDQACDSFTR